MSKKSALQRALFAELSGSGDSRRGLFWEIEFESAQEEFEFLFGLSVARKDDFAAVSGRQTHVDHLEGRELLEDRAGSEAGGQIAQSPGQGDLQAIGKEGDEDMRLERAPGADGRWA